jgi:hypothetical protein
VIYELVGGKMRPLIEKLESPGSFGWDAKRRIFVPLSEAGRVEIRELR